MLTKDGFRIHRAVFTEEALTVLRDAVAEVSNSAGTACVRGLFRRSAVFRELATKPELMQIVGAGLFPVRSILFDKTADENWPVLWHRDTTIAVNEKIDIVGYGPWSIKDGIPHVRPPLAVMEKMITARIHLDKTGAENGALRIVPGSHRGQDNPSDARGQEIDRQAETCECNAGDVLLMSPLLLHSSRKSKTPSHRRIIHIEYAELESLHPKLQWAENTDRL